MDWAGNIGSSENIVEFVLIAEAGSLEAQAVLLCASIRSFGGAFSRSRITVVSPRADRRPSPSTIRKFERLQAEYLALEIDSCCPDYGPSYRVHVAALVERRAGPAVIVQLDSDTVFLAKPDSSLFECEATARPVDVKGMCTTGAGDPFDPYWRNLCTLADVDYEQLPVIRTTVDGVMVRASYNGGFLVARRDLGLFGRTEDIFRRLIGKGLHPWTADGPLIRTGTGLLRGSATAYWGTSQAAFSLAAIAGKHQVRLLPDTYNFPLHSLNQMTGPIPQPLVHLHYHWLFAETDAADLLGDARLALSGAAIEWLKGQLPLKA
jgi:hypothetical protein